MISATTIGLAKIVIGGDAKGVVDGVNKAEGALDKLDALASRGSVYMGRMAAAATAAGVALVAGLAHASAEAIDRQEKLARQLGGTIAGVQALERHAQLAGIPVEELTSAAERLNRRLGEATRDGMSKSADALKRIGLNAKDLSKLDLDERFAAIADRVKAVGLNTQQTADLLGQLGIRSGKIVNLIEEGGDAIRRAREDVKLFGVAVSTMDARQIERANDAMTVFGLAVKGVGNQLAVEMAPLLEKIANDFRDTVKEGGGMGGVVAPAVEKAVYAVGWLGREIHDVRLKLDEAAGDAIDFFNTVAGAVPKAIAAMSFGKLTAEDLGFKPIEHEFGKLRDKIGAPPDPQQWTDWFKAIQTHAKISSITIASIREALNGPKTKAADVDGLASKEREGLEKKLDALKQSIANEDEALRVQRDRQLKDLEEFQQKRIVSVETAQILEIGIRDKYAKQWSDLLFAKFEQDTATEEEMLSRKQQRQLEMLGQFEAQRTDLAEYWAGVRRKIEEKNALDAMQLQAKNWSGIAGIVDGALSNISQIVADEGDKGFTVMKAIATATALVKGYEAAVSAYAFGSKIGGPILGAAMAATSAVATAAMIAKIHGVGSRSGGGGSPSIPAAAAPPIAPSSGGSAAGGDGGGFSRTIYVEGLGNDKNYSADDIRRLHEMIEEWRRDGDTVVLH